MEFCTNLCCLFVVFIINCISQTFGKYCLLNINGQIEYYQCSTFEYCCGNSCCENFGAFYRLWYFWLCLMLALMFCSGGGYWYRKYYFQHRLILSSSRGGNTTMVVMNDIQSNRFRFGAARGARRYSSRSCRTPTNFHNFDSDGLTILPRQPRYPATVSLHPFVRDHAYELESIDNPCNTVHRSDLAGPPPSYYETVIMPPPPAYSTYTAEPVSDQNRG